MFSLLTGIGFWILHPLMTRWHLSFASHLSIVTMQACSRASYSNDSYFGAPVGGNDYSTGGCRQVVGH